MKAIKDFFSGITKITKGKDNEKELRKELKVLLEQEINCQKQIDLLVKQKVKMQIEMAKLESEINSCEECARKSLKIREAIEDNKMLKELFLEYAEELNDFKKKNGKFDEVLNPNSSLPEIERYFLWNHKLYLVDSEFNLYSLSLCNKFLEYKADSKVFGKKNDEILKEYINKFLRKK